MRKEQLLILSRSLTQHRIGGLEVMTWDLAKAITRQGINVIVGTTEIPGMPEKFEQDGVTVQTIPGASPGRYSSRFWQGTKEVFLATGRNKTLGVLGVSSAGREVAMMGALRDQPVVMQAHGTSLGEIRTKWKAASIKSIASSVRNMAWLIKDRSVSSLYDATVCVSETVRQEVLHPLSRLGANDGRVLVIDNGVDQTLFSPNPNARDEIRAKLGWGEDPTIICASRMHEQKGVANLIASFANLCKSTPSARLILVGDGPDAGRLKRIVTEQGLAERVHFSGEVSRQEVARYLNAGDVFAFLSNHVEGAPLNMLEAMAVGLPCVLANHLTNRVSDPRAVWGGDGHNPELVADTLKLALKHAKGGEHSVLDRARSIDHCAALYVELFHDLGASGRYRM